MVYVTKYTNLTIKPHKVFIKSLVMLCIEQLNLFHDINCEKYTFIFTNKLKNFNKSISHLSCSISTDTYFAKRQSIAFKIINQDTQNEYILLLQRNHSDIVIKYMYWVAMPLLSCRRRLYTLAICKYNKQDNSGKQYNTVYTQYGKNINANIGEINFVFQTIFPYIIRLFESELTMKGENIAKT